MMLNTGQPADGTLLTAAGRSLHRSANVHARYLAAIAIILAFALGAIYAINWVVDPLAFGSALGRDVFPSDYRYEAEVRFNTLTLRRPDVVILGTSQTGHGIDPANPLLGGKALAYNASISGGTSAEMLRLMRHVVDLGSVRRVVVGIDFMMTKSDGGNQIDDAFLASDGVGGMVKALKARLSTVMLISSVKQIVEKVAHTAAYADDSGHLLPTRFRAAMEGNGGSYGAVRHNVGQTARSLRGQETDFREDLAGIIELACRGHIGLTLFAPPSHVTMLELLQAAGQWQAFEAWERAVVQAAAAAPCPVAIWDFTQVDRVTTEAVPAPGIMSPMPDYWDMLHYRTNLGNALLNTMFAAHAENVSSAPLGERLTPDNVAAFQRRREAALAAYEDTHPQEVVRTRVEARKAQGD